MPARRRITPFITPFAVVVVLALMSGPAPADEMVAAPADAGAYLAARLASAASDYRAGLGWYDRALATDPDNMVLLDGAVLASIGVGEVGKAAVLARRFVALGGNSQPAYLALLAERAKSGDFAGILAAARDGSSVGTLFDGLVRAWAELGDGRTTAALASFEALSKTSGLEAFGLYHKALALASVGDFEAADAILAGKAAGSIGLNRRGVLAHVQILSQLERNPDALALLERSFGTQQDPGVDDLRRRLAAGEPLPFDMVRNPLDGIAEVFSSLATALNGDAEPEYVLLYARIATHLRPDNSDALLLAAEQLETLLQFDLATETYASIPPGDAVYYIAEIGRAGATRAAGRNEAAIEILQALARSKGEIVAVQVALGDGLRRDEHFAEAIKAYDTAIAMLGEPAPPQWSIYFSRAISHERESHWDLAEADFRMALQLEPDHPEVLNYLGYSFVDRGINLVEALSMIERAVAARPDAGYIIDSLAWALFRLGRYDEALAPMERASLLEPVDAIVTDHLGDVYWAVGRTREAEFQWRRALSFNPTEKDAVRIRHKLEVGLDVVRAEEAKAATPTGGATPDAPVVDPAANGD